MNRHRHAIPLWQQEKPRQSQRHAQPQKNWVPDVVALPEKFARPTWKGHTEDLTHGAHPINQTTRGRSAFFRAEINRRRARHE